MFSVSKKDRKFKIKIYKVNPNLSETSSIYEVEEYINREIVNREDIEFIGVQFVYKKIETSRNFTTDVLEKALIMYNEIKEIHVPVVLNDLLQDGRK